MTPTGSGGAVTARNKKIWLFDTDGYLAERHAGVDDVRVRRSSKRLFRWPQGRRPDDHPGLTELGL